MKKNVLILLLAFCNFSLLNAQMTITEIFYNAPNAGSDTIEYIELYNSSNMMLDLNGYDFSEGINYTFPPNTTIAPGNYIVVSNDSTVMMDVLGVNSYEWDSGGLNNDGEDIQLNDSSGVMVDYVDYLDGGLWPPTADGDGYAMELCDIATDNTDPANWSASVTSTGILIESVLIYGTPGAANTANCAVIPPSTEDIVITEIMYNPPGSDAIGEYMELHNKGTVPIDLSGFSFTSGVTYTFDNITMMGGEYLVLATDSAAVESLYGITARQWTSGGLTNGGEDIVLVDAAGAVVDVVNYDNSSPWAEIADGDGASLILCDVNADNDDPANWSFSTNNTGLTAGGGNDIIFASPAAANTCATTPYLFFNGTTDVTNEGNGTDMFAVRMANVGMMDTADVDIVIMGSGTATDGVDYTIINTTLHFSPEGIGESSVAFIDMALLDDTDIEPDETVVVQMANPTMGAVIATDGTFTITIEDNDGASYPTYTIGTVTTVDAEGVADSLGVACSLTGVVHGVNMFGAGLQFTFIDQNNDGIGLFNSGGDFGYTVTEGDLVTVEGTIGQFNGLTQINPDTVILISSGNPLWNPDIVTTLSEATESQMTKLECVTLVDPTQWTNSGSGFNVDVMVGTEILELRIDSDTDVYGTAPPTGEFTVTGIGGQFDNSNPFDEGYQLFPRYIEDIDVTDCLPPILIAFDDNVVTDIDVPVTISVLDNDNTPNGTTTVDLVDLPVFGSAVVNTDLSITYTPDLGSCGVDAFSYVVCDASPLCDTANVVVNVQCEVEIPLYDIGDINTVDADGVADSLMVYCEVRGIVYGVNLNSAGLQFTIIDPDDKEEGIGNYVGDENFGYTVNEGDEVGVFGTITQFNGLTQMSIDSVYLISSGNPLHDPETVTELNEDTESKLVKIFNLTLDDPSQWSNSGTGFNVSASNSDGTYQIRIDNDVDIYGTNPPDEPFNVTGLGGQYDQDSPFDSGYQLFPRYLQDIEIIISTDDIELENQVRIYPNPTTDVLFVGSGVDLDAMTITNILGQTLKTITRPSNNEAIEVADYATGIYMITFEKDGYRWTKEWVKQ